MGFFVIYVSRLPFNAVYYLFLAAISKSNSSLTIPEFNYCMHRH